MYVELKNMSKSFGSRKVVDRLDLSLEKGKILCLLGSSGCGKTTTLKMAGGFLPSDEGQVVVDGQDLTGLAPEQRPVSTVFQSYALFPHKTVRENVAYGLKFQGLRRREAAEKAMAYLEIVGLSEYAGARIHEISGGQQQRVALARALVVNPKVLLLDEPLSNLDAKLRIKMRDEIKELQARLNMTMIFVTHDQDEAMVLADSMAIMNEGRLVQVGPPKEIYRHPADEFVMNFLGIANRIPISGGKDIFVRPESVRFSEEGRLTGRILSQDFMGFYIQYQVQVGDSTITVRGDSRKAYAPGEQVGIWVDETEALM